LANALDGLLAWLSAHEKAVSETNSQRKAARRWQRAERELVGWFNEFGQLGAPVGALAFEINYGDGPSRWGLSYYAESVEGVVFYVRALRTLVQKIAGHSMGSFGEWAVSIVSEGAAGVQRNPETFEWEAPTLWSLLCAAVLNYEDLDWDFRLCAAHDCTNPLVVTRSNRTMCSKRCSKRISAQRRAERDSAKERKNNYVR